MEPFNQAPFFENPLRTANIPVPEFVTEEDSFDIWLPRILDTGVNDTFTLTFEPRLGFMTYEYSTNTITFKLLLMGKSDIVLTKLMIRLSDQKGAETKYEMDLNFYVPKPVFEVVPEIITPKRIFDFGTGKNVTAFIDKISIFGEVDIEFNATMFNTFNYTMVNNTWIDVYLIPEDPASNYNWTLANFTWELIDYSPNVMRIKIKWLDAASISLKLT